MALSPDSHLGPYRIAELVELRKTGYVSPIAIAAVHAGLGANDVAVEWLEQGARQPGTLQFWIPIDPLWKGLASHPGCYPRDA